VSTSALLHLAVALDGTGWHPQGQPVVAALGHARVPYRLIARSADVGFVTPRDAAHAAEIVTQIRTEPTS